MTSDRFAARERAVLAISAILMLAVAGMFQCPALPIGDSGREVLALVAVSLSALCLALVLEEAMVRPVRDALRLASARLAAC